MRQLGRFFPKDNWPLLLCPDCKLGYLALDYLKTFEESLSKRLRKASEWEPDWISGYFNASLRCPYCSSEVIVVGKMSVGSMQAVGEDDDSQYTELLGIRYTIPVLKTIDFPEGCPWSFEEQIHYASNILLANPDAAANSIRTAVEKLLTIHKVPRYRTNNKGKRVPISMHARIQKLRSREPEVSDMLEAVKWIGNDGSHTGGLTINDVVDSLELLQHAVDKLYNKQPKMLVKLAKQINSRKSIMPPKVRRLTF